MAQKHLGENLVKKKPSCQQQTEANTNTVNRGLKEFPEMKTTDRECTIKTTLEKSQNTGENKVPGALSELKQTHGRFKPAKAQSY